MGRDVDGRYTPGTSGNRRGRPPGLRAIRQRAQARAFRDYDRLTWIADHSEDELAAAVALVGLLGFAWGTNGRRAGAPALAVPLAAPLELAR